VQEHFRWHSPAIAGEQRALGLACSSALRSDRDVEATAVRIVAVADRRSVERALEELRQARHDWPTATRAKAVRALVRAVELHDAGYRAAS
jgi:hypothetical protein